MEELHTLGNPQESATEDRTRKQLLLRPSRLSQSSSQLSRTALRETISAEPKLSRLSQDDQQNSTQKIGFKKVNLNQIKSKTHQN